eukprot:g3930.t1
MHPPLHIHRYPSCQKEILELIACHQEHPIAKFVGVCNEAKHELDSCMKADRKQKRASNKIKADYFKARLRQLEMETKKAKQPEKNL